MRFVYEYRTADNSRHTGAVDARSRDDAYAALKARGIRPSRVEEAPGFLNALFGKGKRWLAIGVLCALCVVLVVIIHSTPTPSTYTSFDDRTRRQLIGDAAVIEKGIATGWAEVFPDAGERFFASYAIPGVVPAVSSVTEEQLREAIGEGKRDEGRGKREEGIEVRQMRALVEGMKEECRRYIADGTSLRAYCSALRQRQEQEIGYYQRAKAEIEQAAKAGLGRAELLALWERRNAQLRKIGVKHVPLPED